MLEEAYNKDERIISVSSNYSDNLSNWVLVNSNGFKGDAANSGLYLYASVSVKTDNGRPSGDWYETAVFYDKLKKTNIGKGA